MSHRLRPTCIPQAHEDLTPGRQISYSRRKYRYIEFKYLYFHIQHLLNKKVISSFKYEQLRTPEIRVSLIKPLVTQIIELSGAQALKTVFSNQLATTPGSAAFETPIFGPVDYGSVPSSEPSAPQLSLYVIYVLLLLKYEYMIQSENNLVMFDLLSTKATICELLAIRILREYGSTERINLLFLNPMARHDEHVELKHTKHFDSFNTLELSILSKSKKFLVLPVVVRILDRIYNGELIMKSKNHPGLVSTERDFEESYLTAKGTYTGNCLEGQNAAGYLKTPESDDYERNIENYKFSHISIKQVFVRSNTVPKYQSLVINMKYGFLTFLYLLLVIKHKQKHSSTPSDWNPTISILFWTVALSFNLDVLVKSLHIEHRFLKKIIWTYIDIAIVTLIDVSFIMRILLSFERIESRAYYNCFSVISILLFPRMLSVFNNYEFFSMIIVSLKKMSWSVIALSCLFMSLIFGFFLCFISLTIDMSTYEVAFAMLKVFFLFTPAVWDNWKSFDNLGRALQIAYLSLIQFVMATIIAIVLSNVFVKVSETNKEEFEYLKTINLIIYLKWAKFQLPGQRESKIVVAFDLVVKMFKLPIIITIYFYEIFIKENKKLIQKQRKDLKHFTFLSHEEDFIGDPFLVGHLAPDEEVTSLRLPGTTADMRMASGDVNNSTSGGQGSGVRKRLLSRKLIPQNSQSTIAGFQSGSFDSMLMDDLVGKRGNAFNIRSKRIKSANDTEKRYQKMNEELMLKLRELEGMISRLVKTRADANDPRDDDYVVREYNRDDIHAESDESDNGDVFLEDENTEDRGLV